MSTYYRSPAFALQTLFIVIKSNKTVNYIQFSGIKILEMGIGKYFLKEIGFRIYLKWHLNAQNRLNEMTAFCGNYICDIGEESAQCSRLSTPQLEKSRRGLERSLEPYNKEYTGICLIKVAFHCTRLFSIQA